MKIQEKDFTQRLTLLYIEDSLHDFDTWLNQKFGTLVTVKNCKDAKKAFDKTYIDMVLIEFENNLEEKFELIKFLKKQRPFIIILTLAKLEDSKLLNSCLDMGVDGFFSTPINKENFIVKLNRLEEKYEIGEEYESNKENLNLLRQYQSITDSSSIVSKTDLKGKITYVNDNFCKISGYTKNELNKKNHNIVRHPDTPKEVYQEMWNTIKVKKEEWNGILRNITKDGESYYVKSMVRPILDKKGNIIEYISLRQNISSVMSDKQHFFDRIEQNILSFLLLIQIDDFDMLEKFYNSTFIDKIEKNFGYNLISYLPKRYKFENVYNLDNGRYALLTDFYKFDEKQINIKEYLDEFINNVKNSILEIDSIEYDINISLSYAMGKHMLYEDAKAGLVEAVNKNITICHSNDFSIKYQDEARKNLDVIKMVKIALDSYKVISYFQPIINNKTKEIEKYESLVRIIDENGKILTPYDFLSISKKGSYYNKITSRVLENSFKMLSQINTKLSINLSTLDIEKEETREDIFNLLDEYKDIRHRLIFELLEDENAKDFETIKKFIKEVKSLGVSIAIDDFGAGYSNFERLLEFSPDILKIDGSLIKNILTDEYSQNVVETIVIFAKKQNIVTIAEFVESEDIFNYLNSIGVDYSQGYYFGKPQELINNLIT